MQQEIVTFTDEDYYQNAIIRPPKDMTFLDNNTRFSRIVVDSRVRDKTLFPNPNSYEVPLEDDVNDVKTAKLIIMDMPMPMYLINTYFQNLYFKIGTTEYIAPVAIGDYNPSDLATAMTTALNTQVASTFSVTYDSRLDNYNINATVSFTLQFLNKLNTLDQLLGFSSLRDYTSIPDSNTPSHPNLVKSQYKKNFDYNNYVIMDIDQFDVVKSIDRELNKSFAMIPKRFSSLNIGDEAEIIKSFSPPLGKLVKLRIKLYDKFGNLYDFQNMDHRFELLITSYKQRRKYMH